MSSHCIIKVNGREVRAERGETLIDACIGGRILVPHDCCSGQCESCRVQIVSGCVADNGMATGGTVLACQATVDGDAEIVFDEVPQPTSLWGTVEDIRPLPGRVMEVVLRLSSPLDYLPGQYVGVKFTGFPSRDLSPTLRLDGGVDRHELVFQIKRYPGGVVSGAIGSRIKAGHGVRVRGPHGSAFLREPRGDGMMVMVSNGTGFAPIWSMAKAACERGFAHRLIVITGSYDAQNLYMTPALDWLEHRGAHDVMRTAWLRAEWPVLRGRPNHYLPEIGPEDTVYVAGSQRLVNAVRAAALRVSAHCYADPFLPSNERSSLAETVSTYMRGLSERWGVGATQQGEMVL